MNIKCLWGTPAKNNEEYRKKLEQRQHRMVGIVVLGCLTLVLGGGSDLAGWNIMSERNASWLCGFGTGLAAFGMLCYLKLKDILKSEEKVKENRLKESDERELEIKKMAMHTTVFLMLITLYICNIVGSFLSQELQFISTLLMALLLLFYVGSKSYYQKKL